MDVTGWHARFQQQARWTFDLRRYLYDQVHITKAQTILEVGCGTGVITTELQHISAASISGIDINLERLGFARANTSSTRFTCGDAQLLPYASGTFDFCLSHFLLLWVKDPRQVLNEMRRVTRPGGVVLALAEPDYGGRIDYPTPLAELGWLQGQALSDQGADPNTGRKLSALFHSAALERIQVGVLGGQWSVMPTPEAWEAEWSVLQSDLEARLDPERLAELRRIDQAAWQHGERILFVPTFYARGRVPQEATGFRG